jgi:hypothetical protein
MISYSICYGAKKERMKTNKELMEAKRQLEESQRKRFVE